MSAVSARRILVVAAALLVATPETASAQSFWNWGAGDYNPQPVRPKRVRIKPVKDPAEAAAKHAAKPIGPLVIAISIDRQRVKIYDDNGLFAESAVSTGTKSHPTPMGVFSIIQKNRHHVSNLYHASMPYMQRITWSGVAMHTGVLPGYAASHGCIRLPNEFAARLWTWTNMGTRVIVSPGEVAPANFSHPKLVTKMVPPPTVSVAPAPLVLAAEAAPPKADQLALTSRRTADARDAIDGMRGTLTDATQGVQLVDRPVANEPSQTNATGDTPSTSSPADRKVDAAAEAESKPRAQAQRAYSAAKGEDNQDNDNGALTTATVDEPAPKPAQVEKAAEAAPEQKPADAVQDIARPADIIKPAEIVPPAKPADVAAPAITPEPAKPADVAVPVIKPEPPTPADVAVPVIKPEPPKRAAAPRRHNHVSVLISRKDKKLYIRHGYEPVFDTPVEIADVDRPLGTHVFTARADKDDDKALQWSVVSLPQVPRRTDTRLTRQQGKKVQPVQQAAVIPPLNPTEALDRITIPAEAMEKIASIIAPGGSLVISDHGPNGWETGRGTDFIMPLR